MGLLFDKVNRIITVESPDTEITIQTLINTIRDWEDELVNLEVAKVADASGKDDLGGGLAVGTTLKLLNWKVKFEDRPGPDWVGCGVTGGNLIAVDANNAPMNPIEPSSYVTVTVEKAVSAVITAAEAEWTGAEKSQVFTEFDEVKHTATGAYERDRESLEAIRERGDEAWVTKKASFRL